MEIVRIWAVPKSIDLTCTNTANWEIVFHQIEGETYNFQSI